MSPLVCVGLLAVLAAAAWVAGELADRRWVRVPAVLALLPAVAVPSYVLGGVGTWIQAGSAYAERLEPFRAAAAARLEAGDADAVADELRAMGGQLTYESGLTFRALEAVTGRLSGERPASGAGASTASP